jgi:hypothetical protein
MTWMARTRFRIEQLGMRKLLIDNSALQCWNGEIDFVQERLWNPTR